MSNAKLAQWKKNAEHEVTLPSNTKVKIRLPNLPKLIETGQIPNHLIDAAIGASTGEVTVSKDLLVQQAEFSRKLVAITVVDPVLTEADADDIPFEDQDLIVALATRQRDVDAIGHHIGGLDSVAEWRRFRGLEDGN